LLQQKCEKVVPLKHDWQGITREHAMMPLDSNGGAFKWGINASDSIVG